MWHTQLSAIHTLQRCGRENLKVKPRRLSNTRTVSDYHAVTLAVSWYNSFYLWATAIESVTEKRSKHTLQCAHRFQACNIQRTNMTLAGWVTLRRLIEILRPGKLVTKLANRLLEYKHVHMSTNAAITHQYLEAQNGMVRMTKLWLYCRYLLSTIIDSWCYIQLSCHTMIHVAHCS